MRSGGLQEPVHAAHQNPTILLHDLQESRRFPAPTRRAFIPPQGHFHARGHSLAMTAAVKLAKARPNANFTEYLLLPDVGSQLANSAAFHPSLDRSSDFGLSCSAHIPGPESVAWALLLLMFFNGIPLELQAVMDYLASEKDAEGDLWRQDDLQIAWLTCLYAGRGQSHPHVDATVKVLGLHPNKVWPAILAQRLAKGFPGSTSEGTSLLEGGTRAFTLPRDLASLAVKKPCRSVREFSRKRTG